MKIGEGGTEDISIFLLSPEPLSQPSLGRAKQAPNCQLFWGGGIMFPTRFCFTGHFALGGSRSVEKWIDPKDPLPLSLSLSILKGLRLCEMALE